MKTGIHARVSRVLLLLFSIAGTSHAQESFVVAGPLVQYIDLSNVPREDHTFTATIHYDPNVLLVNSLSSGMFEDVYFNEAITQIEYAVFDGQSNEILRRIEEGNVLGEEDKSTYIRARNGIAGSSKDELEYYAFGQSFSHAAQITITFSETSGTLLEQVSAVPEPPPLGDIDFTSVSIMLIESENGLELDTRIFAEGLVTMIDAGETDPYEQCAEEVRNHGQYVRCVSHVSNALRALGEISGEQKGQHQKQAARSKK
jgi:hypothetical protein